MAAKESIISNLFVTEKAETHCFGFSAQSGAPDAIQDRDFASSNCGFDFYPSIFFNHFG